MEQRGLPIDPEKIPLEFDDLNENCQTALLIYNRLGNRADGNIGFMGKDYTNLSIILEFMGVEPSLHLLDLLLTIEVYYIDQSQKAIQKLYKDSNKKSP